MTAVVHLTRAQQLATSIEAEVARRALTAGDALGTLDEWRDRTGFARATVSEAVRILADRGLVQIRPGRGGGIFVARTDPIVRLRHTLLTVRGEAADVADAIAIRDALEPLIVADAVRLRTKKQTAQLQAHLADLESAVDDRDTFMRANWALHDSIAQITPNVMLSAVYLSMTALIRESSLAAVAATAHDESYVASRLEIHTDLVEAIASGDADRAAAAVARHSSKE